ncbi:MAG: transposase [Calditrichaeota bacterium]|nr:transposase [Calditrichota bacterium]
MSRNYRYWNQDYPHFISFATVNWVDVFIRRNYCETLLNVIEYYQKENGLLVYGWCLMPSHVHMIIGRKGVHKQEHLVRDIKRTSSKKLLKQIKENPQESRKEWMLDIFAIAGQKNSNNWHFQFWQQHNQPLEIDNKRKLDSYLSYIHRNPVVAGFVDYEQEYRYSSARDYCGFNGLLKIKNVLI